VLAGLLLIVICHNMSFTATFTGHLRLFQVTTPADSPAPGGALLLLLSLHADILAGQGMYFSVATNAYRAVNCSSDNFGVANTTYGLAAYPCRDCPAGMQTSTSLPTSAAYYVSHGFTNPMACVTKPGYGYDGRVANKCPPGSYNAEGNYNTCTQCPTGLSTPDDAGSQVSEANCTLTVGYGFHGSTIMPCPMGKLCG